MTRMLSTVVFPLCIATSLIGCSSEESTPAIVESDEARACRMGAESMIDVARQAVAEPSSRPERRAARRELMEDWIARLEAGEDPCVVYSDIGAASTTF